MLVIDDDPVMHEVVGATLEHANHRVLAADCAGDGLRSLFAERPDLVVLDVDLPDMDGREVLGRIRDLGDLPVLMLTAKDDELEKVRALRGGADDYLTKPFGTLELAARVEALLRRAAVVAGDARDVYADRRLILDHGQRVASRDGVELALTPLEFGLLAAFARHPNQVLSQDQLLEIVWRDPHVSPAQVKLYVSRLRRKLAPAKAIETVRGFGYRFGPLA